MSYDYTRLLLAFGLCVVMLLVTSVVLVLEGQQLREGNRICQEQGYARAVHVESVNIASQEIDYVECSPEPKPVKIQVYANE